MSPGKNREYEQKEAVFFAKTAVPKGKLKENGSGKGPQTGILFSVVEQNRANCEKKSENSCKKQEKIWNWGGLYSLFIDIDLALW